MRLHLVTKPLTDITSDYLILPVFEGEQTNYPYPLINEFLKENPKFGKNLEGQIIYTKERKIQLLGLGKKEEITFERLQNWVGTAVKSLGQKAKTISLLLPTIETLSLKELGSAVAIGSEIAAYDPAKEYKSEYEPVRLTTVEVIVEKADRGYQDGLKLGMVIAEGINLARRLGDMPSNQMTPTYFLNTAKKIARDNRLKITVLDEKMAKKMGMGAFTGVAQGSEEPSYMIALEYEHRSLRSRSDKGDIRSKDKWGLVGKGITFDSGGISIKPSNNMHEMKYDMSGAASILGSMQVISKLGLKINVVGIMAVTENLPGGRAQRPGDIVKSYCGKIVEVMNTDAEGRLVLIDAVAYAQKDFKANKIIDLATLTGAIIVALGYNITGVFGNDKDFTRQVIDSGEAVGEKMWEMPMHAEFNEMIKSEFADIMNIGNVPSAAGSVMGAKFIEAGIEKGTPWVHLDIAGTAWDTSKKPFRALGATGVGIKTIVQLLTKG